ncbi:MAG: leucine-rich repeat domain-containing protein, partial [Clostridia bacterium]|nr:leucine-rich repeat domain-containing protein [Clostridia bacterium]
CTSLEKINLEETQIDNIRTNAFYGCESLENVVLPDTIRMIYSYAFVNTAMKTLTLPNLPTDGRIMSYAFAFNPHLETLYLPETMTEIEAFTFAETGLKEVYLPSSLKRGDIDHRAFYLCSRLERFIVDEDNTDYGVTKDGILYIKPYQYDPMYGNPEEIPATLFLCPLNVKIDSLVIDEMFEEIPANFFQLTSSIRKIVVPETVKTIGAGAFSYSRVEEVEFAADSPIQLSGYSQTNIFDGCEDLTKVVLPENLNCITAQMFYGCINLEEIVLPESVEVVYDGAFYGCESLKSINLENVKRIEGAAFAYCKSLEEISIGAQTNFICFDLNYTAFESCTALKNVSVDAQNKIYKSIDGVLFDKSGSVLYLYPASKEGSEYSVPEGVTKIAEYAFGENKNLKKVVLPKTLAVVGTFAFYKTDKLDTYVFLSQKAPTLEGQYSEVYGLTLYVNFLDISSVYFDYPLYLYHAEGATGYDMFLYREFFYEIYTLDKIDYVPSPEQPIEDNFDKPTGGNTDESKDYVLRYTEYIESLQEGASDGLKEKLDALKEKFEAEYDAFFDMFADDEKAQESFYNTYVAEADKIYLMDVELYAARWLRIHEVIELIAELKNTYTYSEKYLELMDTIAYSTQYILVRSYTLEDIEANYVYYRDFVLGIPKEGEETEFSEYLNGIKSSLEAEYEQFLQENSSLYDEDVLEAIEIEYTEMITKVAQAESRSIIGGLIDGWKEFLKNVVTAENREAFEQEKAALIATLDEFKEEDYEYSLWLVMKDYKEDQIKLLENVFVIDQVRTTVEFTYNELAAQESKMQTRKNAALEEFDGFIEYYNMYSYLYDANMKELRLIVAEEAAKIEASTTVAEVADALDAAFDRVWKYYEYHQKAYTEYRRALAAFEALSEEDKAAAMAELNAISYRVATNSGKIAAIIEKYCGENA